MLRDMHAPGVMGPTHAPAPSAAATVPASTAAAAAAPGGLVMQRVALPSANDGSPPEAAPPVPFEWTVGEYM